MSHSRNMPSLFQAHNGFPSSPGRRPMPGWFCHPLRCCCCCLTHERHDVTGYTQISAVKCSISFNALTNIYCFDRLLFYMFVIFFFFIIHLHVMAKLYLPTLPLYHKNIRIEETARGQLMTYTRQFLVPHPWNNPIFIHSTCYPHSYSDPTIF